MTIELDKIYNCDCLDGMRSLPDGSIDCVIADPPYEVGHVGGGHFGKRGYYNELAPISEGITDEYIDEMVRVCKKPNIYLFCSKHQLPQFLNYAVSHKFNFDVLTWHKTNPTPACENTYLSDTEYCVFMRKGAKLYGSYATKAHYWLTQVNKKDKDLYGHPTIKPLEIIRSLIVNSTQMGGVILDPFIGSGTTAIAAIRENRHFIGFELAEEYYKKAVQRIKNEQRQLTLF